MIHWNVTSRSGRIHKTLVNGTDIELRWDSNDLWCYKINGGDSFVIKAATLKQAMAEVIQKITTFPTDEVSKAKELLKQLLNMDDEQLAKLQESLGVLLKDPKC